MKVFNFTDILDRTGKDAIAIDPEAASFAAFPPVKEGFSRIPMWVADMNFPTAPSITEAIIKRAGHPAFGYFAPKDDYFDAIIGWQKNRNGVDGLTREAIGYENGVLGGVVSAMKAAASPGDRSSFIPRLISALPMPWRTRDTASSYPSSNRTPRASSAWTLTTWKPS